jgi:hypothetical protein
MTETANHEKMTRTPHRKEAALVGERLRLENVITENLAAYQSSQQKAYVGNLPASPTPVQEGI